MAVLVDFKASRLPETVMKGEGTFHDALLVYTLCLIATLLLIVLGTLFMFLILLNAAYKVRLN